MRHFFHSYWKVILVLILLIVAAALFMRPDSASAAPSLAERLRGHVDAIASGEHNTRQPAELERTSTYIETELARAGYQISGRVYAAGGQRVRNIEAVIGNVAPGRKPERIFIVGAHYDSARGAPDANHNGSGTAAVLELARMLKSMQPAAGTKVRFVFFVNEEASWFMGSAMGSLQHVAGMQRQGLEERYPGTGNFLAFVGTLESSALVREALAVFRAASDFPAHGLAAPAHTTGVTLSDHSAFNRHGYPALMVTDTAFMRYPYYHTAEDTADQLDYESMARVVTGLAKTIGGLAGAAKG